MYSKLSVLIPTRCRVQRLETLLGSYRNTTSPGHSELVFRIDEDDQESYNFLQSCAPHQVVVGPRLKGYQSMPEFFNELAGFAQGDVLMCGNDDMVFQTLDWDQKILEVANDFSDGLFDIGVSTLNHTHYPFSCVSKRAVEKMGYLWDPSIFWGDIFLRDVMAWFDRLVYLPEVRIDHDWAGFRPDKVFAESDKDILRRDPMYWESTHATAVQNAVSRLKELLA